MKGNADHRARAGPGPEGGLAGYPGPTFDIIVELVEWHQKRSRSSIDGKRRRFVLIRCREALTRRECYFYDWSGSDSQARLMEELSEQGYLLRFKGYINFEGYTVFLVLRRWAVWNQDSQEVLHPRTGKAGKWLVLPRRTGKMSKSSKNSTES